MDSAVHQFLTFSLGSESYAVKVKNVREVLEVVPITHVPGMPAFMKGVLNLRGSVVPVIDLRKKFGMTEAVKTVDTSIIIMEIENGEDTIQIGVFVDSVHAVIELLPDKIEPAPSMGINMKTGFIDGMCEYENKFLIILNINQILSTEELIQLPNKEEILLAGESVSSEEA
ncbi:MAG: chemotaxis protein CheW [Spirochaetales bacterium]|nr:chemotaxis protein CheW [Spirochaetales bacterium]